MFLIDTSENLNSDEFAEDSSGDIEGLSEADSGTLVEKLLSVYKKTVYFLGLALAT